LQTSLWRTHLCVQRSHSCERAVLFLCAACCIFSRSAPPLAFEAASVKPNTTGSDHSSTNGSAGQIVFTNVSLGRLIQRAYGVKSYQLTGPDWMDTVKFDIVAKYPAGASKDQRPPMLRTLLAERFHLAIHLESKEMPAYALVVAKGGPKLQAAEPLGHSSDSRGRFDDQGVSMAVLADRLASQLEHPVVDKTALTGAYNLKLEWTADDRQADKGDPATGPSIFAALQEQLGLKLQTEKLPIEIVIVDHVDRTPVEN
jgi:uncharacterized protein (TIGR03435 family)